MTQHTPGPWTVKPAEAGPKWDCIYAGDTHVACVGHPQANARLIAAAPRMLAYIESCAAANDPEARALLKEIGG